MYGIEKRKPYLIPKIHRQIAQNILFVWKVMEDSVDVNLNQFLYTTSIYFIYDITFGLQLTSNITVTYNLTRKIARLWQRERRNSLVCHRTTVFFLNITLTGN